jgi:hypothetical protein
MNTGVRSSRRLDVDSLFEYPFKGIFYDSLNRSDIGLTLVSEEIASIVLDHCRHALHLFTPIRAIFLLYQIIF